MCEGKEEREIKQLDHQLTEPRRDTTRRAVQEQAMIFDWANE